MGIMQLGWLHSATKLTEHLGKRPECSLVEFIGSIANIFVLTAIVSQKLGQQFSVRRAMAGPSIHRPPLQPLAASEVAQQVSSRSQRPQQEQLTGQSLAKVKDIIRLTDGGCYALFLGVQLPISTLRVLTMRLDLPLFGTLAIVLVALSVVTAPVAIILGTPQGYISVLIGSGMSVIVLLGVAFVMTSSNDAQWREICNFSDHRNVRQSTKNVMALLSIGATAFQMPALMTQMFRMPKSGGPKTTEIQVKEYLANLLGISMLRIDGFIHVFTEVIADRRIQIAVTYAPLALASLCALIWYSFYAGILHKIITEAAPVKPGSRVENEYEWDPEKEYNIENVDAGGTYLNVVDGGTSNGTRVHLWDNGQSCHTQWRIAPASHGSYTIESVSAKGKYLSVKDKCEEFYVQLCDNPNSDDSHWRITGWGGGGICTIENVSANSKLNAAGQHLGNGAKVQMLLDGEDPDHTQWRIQAPQSRIWKDMVQKKEECDSVRRECYTILAERSAYTSLFLFLSDTLLTFIIASLVKTDDCVRDENGLMHLKVDSEIICFTGVHGWFAVFGNTLFIFFSVTAVLTAPFIIADSAGAFSSPELDIRYEPLFYLQERIYKCALAGAMVYFGGYPSFCRNLNFAGSVWMAYVSTAYKPCSVPWVNTIRSAMFQVVSAVSVGVIIDAIVDFGKLPLLMVLAVIMIEIAWAVWTLLWVDQSPPEFELSRTVGRTFGDSSYYNDVSILRGVHHRLKSISIWCEVAPYADPPRKDCLGVQCVYEVDGAVIAGPKHAGASCSTGPPSETIDLEDDEFLVRLGGTFDERLKLRFETSKGRLFSFMDPSDDLSCGHQWEVEAKPKEVVAIYGSHNGNMHSFGFVLCRVQEDLSSSKADSEREPLNNKEPV